MLAGSPSTKLRPWLEQIQNDLFDLGADLTVPLHDARDRLRVTPAQVEWLEPLCDAVNDGLRPLRSFVLPGGTEAAARLHVSRTACRSAERRVVALAGAEPVSEIVVAYLNRLSDLLFILARAENAAGGQEETLWKPGAAP